MATSSIITEHLSNTLGSLILLAIVFLGSAGLAQTDSPSASIIDKKFISTINTYLSQEIITQSIRNQNKKYKDLTQEQINKLDKEWRAETKIDKKPLIAATVSNPLSSYLTRLQAHSIGLFSEIFIMDALGLNVGQSNITSDFWQGDEAKWQKTYSVGPNAVFIDEPEWHEGTQTWRAQANFSITDPNTQKAIGAATFEINLSELQRRRK